jgi:hypothetical protein
MSKISLAHQVCICTCFHVCMYACDLVRKRACRVHVYAQMERWLEIGIRSFDKDKHVWRYAHARIHVRACPYRVFESGIGAASRVCMQWCSHTCTCIFEHGWIKPSIGRYTRKRQRKRHSHPLTHITRLIHQSHARTPCR